MLTPFSPHYGDQFAGVGDAGDGIEEVGADPAEDGAVSPNAESQGKHRCRRKGGALGKRPEAITKILQQCMHGNRPGRLPPVSFLGSVLCLSMPPW